MVELDGQSLEPLIATFSYVQIREYASVAAFVYLVLDFFQTLESEVRYIWSGRLNGVKILFFGVRYLPLLNLPLLLVLEHGPETRPERCKGLYGLFLFLVVLSIAFGDAIAYLRVHALRLEKRSRWFTAYLSVHFTALYLLITATFFLDLIGKIVFTPSPFPDKVQCYLEPNDGPVPMAIPFILLLCNINFICTICKILIFRNYRNCSGPLVAIFHLDGSMGLLIMTLSTSANLAFLLKGPPEYRFLLLPAHQAIHSTLASRILLRMREAVYRRAESTLDPNYMRSALVFAPRPTTIATA
ncbi:hypothetical protein D9611_010932 [Ephemerocybe angulata]|uniref:DUF6533 domain-containing protein n=1 Tax=Ephemerocybe angulata TaxID=980116 RepID=A0A8H5FFS5_9AGAR|nr:hypothetical protein D9611_010932 [Tulosesus angulatus]